MFAEELFRKTVIDALNLRPGEYRDDLALGEVNAWDSVGHLGLVFALEAAFGTKFDLESIPELNSLPKLRAALTQKGMR